MFTIDILIIFKCPTIIPSIVATQAILHLCHLCWRSYLLGREKYTSKIQKKSFRFVLAFRTEHLSQSHRLCSCQLSVTFPSSMGLSLMCTTGPGCVLVDLCEF